MSYREGDKLEMRSKMPKMVNIVSTGLRRSYGLNHKPQNKYGLFAKLSILAVGACEVARNPQISLTRSNQHIQ